MSSTKILLLLGHPNANSLGAGLSQSYADAAQAAGLEVRIHRIADMAFDPTLHLGYQSGQTLEPDVAAFQEDLRWCEHFVMVFPLWWGGMPAKLKGLIDRSFLPGFAFKYQEGSAFPAKLLQGKSSRVIITMDSPNFWYNWVLGRPLTKAIRRQILGFSGFKPCKFTILGNVRASNAAKRDAWMRQLQDLGKNGR